MKVNISGRGLIPGVNRLAPVRNVELSQKDILRLLNYRQFSLYVSETGLFITKSNIDNLFKPVIKPRTVSVNEKPIQIKPMEEIKETKKEEKPQFLTITEIPTTNTTENKVIEPVIENETIIKEEIATEVENQITEETKLVEEVVEKTTEETKSVEEIPSRQYYNNRRKNKKR